MHTELRAEELAWFFLFPKGRNELHESSRLHTITPLDYCQARIMCQDPRFQWNDYLFYSYPLWNIIHINIWNIWA